MIDSQAAYDQNKTTEVVYKFLKIKQIKFLLL